MEGAAKVCVGGGAIAKLILEGLAEAGDAGDDDGTGVGIGADDVADEEIAGAKLVDVFGAGESGEEVALGGGAFGLGEGLEGGLEGLVGGA